MCGHFVASLAVLLALSCGSQALEVTIKYSDPVLEFTLPLFTREASAVAFHYAIKHVEYTGRGVQTREGWTYATRDVSLDGAESVTAYAVVYDINGNKRMTTQRSKLLLDVRSAPVARLPNRRIRGAVFFRDDFNSFNTNNWNYEVSMFGGYTLTVDDPRFDENFLYHGKMDMNKLFGYCTEAGNYGCTREGQYGMLPPIMSGKVESKPTIRYGIVEIRARIPQGDWIWPALWLMPRNSKYGNWPRSGEIDVMESRGNTGPIGIQQVSSTLHWGPSADQNKFYKTTNTRTFVDNQEILRVGPNFWQKGGFSGTNIWASGEKMAPFDQPFYIMFNVAVGGTSGMFPDGNHYNGARKPWSNGSPHAAQDFWNGRGEWLKTWHGGKTAMLVDYVEFRHL
ncbi:beta-1,3-glucan-binding protein [Elysia marginata]|uniref:Beta-1,3-glucan-binding protein n=1 Tax=Elysia marginata TaxID=1093978 RepID=A0AAV4IRN4_9GAST|nr:beta-1,3-glucan-binding protein [Elysia marginata]